MRKCTGNLDKQVISRTTIELSQFIIHNFSTNVQHYNYISLIGDKTSPKIRLHLFVRMQTFRYKRGKINFLIFQPPFVVVRKVLINSANIQKTWIQQSGENVVPRRYFWQVWKKQKPEALGGIKPNIVTVKYMAVLIELNNSMYVFISRKLMENLKSQ